MKLRMFFVSTFIICLTAGSVAQKTDKLDSLLNALEQVGNDKKKQADIYRQLGLYYTRKDDFSEALRHFNSFLELSLQTVNKKEVAKAHNDIANTYFYKGNYPEALKHHYASVKNNKEIGNQQGLVISYNNIGLVLWNNGNYPDAYKSYNTALKIREQLGDKQGLAHSYNVLGVVYDDEGNYPEALKNYLISLKIYEQLKARFGIAACLNNIGELYRKQTNYEASLKNYRAALKLYKEMGDQGGVAMANNNMADILLIQGNYVEAEKNCLEALKINEESDDKYGIAAACINLGTVYYERAKLTGNQSSRVVLLEKALQYAFRALKNFEAISQKQGVAACYNLAGSIYTFQGKFVEAKKYLTDGMRLSKETGVKDQIKSSYESMSFLDSSLGNWEAAFRNRQMFILYRDSLLNKENTGKIQLLQMQYEFDKKADSLRYDKGLINEKLLRQTLLSRQQMQAMQLKEKELKLLNNEKRLQFLEMEKVQANSVLQEAQSVKKHNELMLMSKEKEIQSLELKKERQFRNYLMAGILLLVVLSGFAYNNYRTRQKLKLQTLRNKIARDLHDDVGSTLSSISIFSQMAQQQSREVIPMLETIGESSRKMLEAMGDIVWTINPENDQFEKIILRMRSFAYELLGAKNIDFEFSADEDIARLRLPMTVRKNLYLIFKEATNNMVKYSEADKAMFMIKGEKNNLTLLINDNGKGFDTKMATRGNGLKNMKKRAEEISALFNIDSYPGKGTTVELKIAI